MAVTHSTASRNLATNAVVDQLDGAGSKLCFRISAAGAIAATLVMATPAFGASGAVLAGRADAGSIVSDTNAAGNGSAVSHATLQTSGDVVAITCEVAASGKEIDMAGGLTIGAGDTVSCSALTYVALAS